MAPDDHEDAPYEPPSAGHIRLWIGKDAAERLPDGVVADARRLADQLEEHVGDYNDIVDCGVQIG